MSTKSICSLQSPKLISVITGTAGFPGSQLADLLLALGHRVIANSNRLNCPASRRPPTSRASNWNTSRSGFGRAANEIEDEKIFSFCPAALN
jgi:nucleoside-diphosphate-sugar epimerase